MTGAEQGKMLELYMAESDRLEGRPLYEEIVAKCRELKVSGVTVFRGLEGYGPTAEIQKPVAILIVDTTDVIDRAMPALEQLMQTRMMAVSAVQMKRVQKS